MFKNSITFRLLFVAMIVLGTAALMLGAGDRAHSDAVIVPGDDGGVLLSRVRVIDWRETDIGLFDTTNGAIYDFNGNFESSTFGGEWTLNVRPVDSRTSGLLELQHARGETFLVDVVSGRTWLLRRTANQPRWDEIPIFRR